MRLICGKCGAEATHTFFNVGNLRAKRLFYCTRCAPAHARKIVKPNES